MSGTDSEKQAFTVVNAWQVPVGKIKSLYLLLGKVVTMLRGFENVFASYSTPFVF